MAAELDKISTMEAQISLALEEIGAKEQEAIDSFQKQGGDLKLAIAKLEAARGQVETKVSPQLLDVYNRTAARSGVAIGVLDGHRCGVAHLPYGHRRRPSHRSAQPGTAGYVPLVQAFAGDRIISVALSPRAVL